MTNRRTAEPENNTKEKPYNNEQTIYEPKNDKQTNRRTAEGENNTKVKPWNNEQKIYEQENRRVPNSLR